MGYIKSTFIQYLLEDTNILDVISDYVKLKKTGANYFGLSPFTKEKSPSFCVNEVKQRFYCWSSHKKGNVIDFLMEHNTLSFPEAIEQLASKYGKQVEYENPEISKNKAEKIKKKEDFRHLLKSTLKKYQELLHELPEEHSANKEISFREYDKQTVIDWGIGYSPGNKFIYQKVVEIGRKEDAKEIGLISDTNDKYYNRLIYPIHDKFGRLVGLAGRNLGNTNTAKWINASASVLYQKDRILFGLNRALKSIVEKNEVWIVEGYNDVIAWQTHELLNTVAPCGTAITEGQMKELKKLCSNVVLCFDDDKAGKKAILKYIPEFLKLGFSVSLFDLSGFDPDEYVRVNKDRLKKQPLSELATDFNLRKEGFSFLLEEKYSHLENLGPEKSEIQRNKITKELCKLIVGIPDEAAREAYTGWLHKKSKVTKASINKWIKSQKQTREEEKEENTATPYRMPKSLDIPFSKVENDVYKYGLFQADGRIWMARKSILSTSFVSVSNFTIHVIQHMQDEKHPSKLIRIENTNNEKAIFDAPSNAINTPMSFDTMITNYGNYRWLGSLTDHSRLKTYLMDKMGNGRRITVLGWQPEGFYCFNNKIIVPGEKEIIPDQNGVFEFNGISYYIPSANELYTENHFKFQSQKRFKSIVATVSFKEFCSQMQAVHRGHCITAVLYSVTCVFRDIIIDQFGNFPILFLYGPAGTGKDEIAKACKSFFGIPQTALNLESGISTSKAQVREFAQFSNGMVHLSEYKRGEHDGMLKGIWDNVGYKRGNIDSHVANESIPILSGVILTGNEHPDKEPVITRFIWEEFTKNEFSLEEISNFEKLEKIVNAGYSSFTDQIIQHRQVYRQTFYKQYKWYKKYYTKKVDGIHSRVVHNLSILGATYDVMRHHLDFSFTYNQMNEHFLKSIQRQKRKLESSSIVNKWWDCFIASTRGSLMDQLQIGRDYKLNGNNLVFNFTNVFNKIQVQWRKQYTESSPSKSVMQDILKRQDSFVEYKDKERIQKGKNATSAYIIDISKMQVKNDLLNAIEWQMKESGLLVSTPKAPGETAVSSPNMKSENNQQEQEELPF